jgi:hypothetical protein
MGEINTWDIRITKMFGKFSIARIEGGSKNSQISTFGSSVCSQKYRMRIKDW